MILSRSRWSSISTNKLLPDFIEIVVPESQKDEYAKVVPNPLITTPDDVLGLGALRNWCIDNFKEETIIMLDDDIYRLYCITGAKARHISNKNVILEILVNDAIMAKDMGTNCFGYTQTDIRKYNAHSPFTLNTWVGGIIGVIGKGQRFRNDYFKVDIDFCLQTLMNYRILLCDNRYQWCQYRDNNKGGNSQFRTKEAFDKSVETLKAKWGECITINRDKHTSQISIKLNVPRKQDIKQREKNVNCRMWQCWNEPV